MHMQGHVWHSTTSLGWTLAASSNFYSGTDETDQTWVNLCVEHKALGSMAQHAAKLAGQEWEHVVETYIAEEQHILLP